MFKKYPSFEKSQNPAIPLTKNRLEENFLAKIRFEIEKTVLTNAAVLSSVAISTYTSVIIHGVDTSSSVVTRLDSTIIDICSKNKVKKCGTS